MIEARSHGSSVHLSIRYHHNREKFLICVGLSVIKDDDLVKRQNPMAKEKAPNSRRANPEE